MVQLVSGLASDPTLAHHEIDRNHRPASMLSHFKTRCAIICFPRCCLAQTQVPCTQTQQWQFGGHNILQYGIAKPCIIWRSFDINRPFSNRLTKRVETTAETPQIRLPSQQTRWVTFELTGSWDRGTTAKSPSAIDRRETLFWLSTSCFRLLWEEDPRRSGWQPKTWTFQCLSKSRPRSQQCNRLSIPTHPDCCWIAIHEAPF
jgi:hypothetical protein